MIFIDADWKGLGGPQRVGVARTSSVRGRETLAFSFDPLRTLESAARKIDADGGAAWNAGLQLLFAPGSSLGGARPKASVAAPDGSLWVAKFPSSRDEVDVGAWEGLTYDLATRCGLLTTEARSESFSRHGRTFLIRRFDRDGPARIHFASARCLLATYRDPRSH